MQSFTLGDLEKLHLALDMAARFVRGEKYHGDKPQVLLQDFERIMEKVRDLRRDITYARENRSLLSGHDVQDADQDNQNPAF